MTFADLDALLTRALTLTMNPAIRLLHQADRTVEGLARTYLPRRVFWLRSDGVIDETCHVNTVSALRGWSVLLSTELDLTDAGTVGAVKTALGLALGLDPGIGASGVSWRPDGPGWRLEGVAATLGHRGCVWFEARDQDQLDDVTDPGCGDGPLDAAHALFLHAPSVANEDNTIKALMLAVRHVLGVT